MENKSLKEKNRLAIQEANAQLANKCCPYWTISIKYTWTGPQVTCTTGGKYQCVDCNCPDSGGGGGTVEGPVDQE